MAFKSVSLVGLLVAAVGCTSVKSVQPAEYIPQHSPEVVWVTYTDQSFVPVTKPRIVGDSLMGTWQGLGEPVAISLKEISTVQAKMPNPKKTTILVGTLAVVGTAVTYTLLTAGNSGTGGNGCPPDKNGQPVTSC